MIERHPMAEDYTIAEIANVSVEVLSRYPVVMEGRIVNYEEFIMDMFHADDDISNRAKQILFSCLEAVMDVIREDDGEEPENRVGFDYPN